MTAEGLVLVERYHVGALERKGNDPASLMKRYRGFDGIVWPGESLRDFATENGVTSLSELRRLRTYYDALKDELIVDLIYLSADVNSPVVGFDFVGFDVGYFESEYSHYSVILNEVLFGSDPRLLNFTAALNDRLLFSSLSEGQSLVEVRQALLADTAVDIERGDAPIEVVPVYAIQRVT